MGIITEKTTTNVTFVAPDGTICRSELLTDYVNDYKYVADGNGETWLLEQVHILIVETETEIEIIEFDIQEIE